jgi:hypothetical protein
MQSRDFAHTLSSLPVLGMAFLAGLIECVALWRSRHRRRGESSRRA